MKHTNPFSILLNVLENIWQHQYDVTYESIQKRTAVVAKNQTNITNYWSSQTGQRRINFVTK
jgi:hypothetical protein